LRERTYDVLICDEAHYLKSYDSKRSKELSPLITKCKRVVLVTGTPIINRPVELFNLLKILRP
jgi:SNF2 family DNA or RNA helicase